MPQPELDEIASVVAMAVENALSQLREKFAASEARVTALDGTVADLRVRLAAAEAKSAPVVDTKVYERIAAAESELKALPDFESRLVDVRDRLLTWEAKQAIALPSAPPDEGLNERVRALSALPERLASVEATVATLPEALKAVREVSDRQLAMEAKASVTPPPETDVRDHLVLLSPVMERLATAEEQIKSVHASVQTVDGLKDRVVALESKEAPPAQSVDTELRERVASAEATLALVHSTQKDVAELRERVVVAETKSAAPVASVAPDPELFTRISALEVRTYATSPAEAAVERLEQRVEAIEAFVAKDIPAMRERLAVAEVRAFTPGPAGAAGRDGLNGVDGIDGVSFDELTASLENERTVVLRATKGDRVKEIGALKVPFMIFRGTWVEKDYEPGDVVNWSGSGWHCQAPTKAKPGESPDWKLFVKRGSDGKDFREDSPNPLPIVRTR